MKTNQFEAVCELASDEWWCWDLNCTTCGNMHFTYAFKEMSLGKSPEDDDWLINQDVDHEKLFAKYGRPVGPPYYKVPLSDFGKKPISAEWKNVETTSEEPGHESVQIKKDNESEYILELCKRCGGEGCFICNNTGYKDH